MAELYIGVCLSANDFSFLIISLPATIVAVICDKFLLDIYRMSARSCVMSGVRESVHILILWKCCTHFDYARYCVHVYTKWCWANLILVWTCSVQFLLYIKLKSDFFIFVFRKTVYNTKYWWVWKSVRLGTFIFMLFFFQYNFPDSLVKTIMSFPVPLTFRRRIKSRLPYAGIISRLPYSTRFQDKG